MYDVTVVGARCAGAPLGMLLARQGFSVLLVDRSTFPSDIMSTHYLHPWGLAYLRRWGVLDQVLASGCPPIRNTAVDFGFTRMTVPVVPGGEVSEALCPRRTVLDHILAQAAVAAGAELREGFSVQGLIVEDGAVTGIRGRDRSGGVVEERSRIVIGADGRRSFVARTVKPDVYDVRPSFTSGYYSYYRDLPLGDTAEIYVREGQVALLFPTNDGLTCAGLEFRHDGFEEFRKDIEGNFLLAMDSISPELGQRVRAAQRVERFDGEAEIENVFRKPFGPGWALVGDAGYLKDPITGTGMSDAWRDVDFLATALTEGLGGKRDLMEALAWYEEQRNAAAKPLYEHTVTLASLPAPQLAAQAMMAARQAS